MTLSFRRLLLSLYRYFCFFLLMAFVISCSMILFLSTIAETMQLEFTEENIRKAAILTFWNVVFLSFICTVIDILRRKWMIERPVKVIVKAASEIAKGNYAVRVPRLSGLNRADGLTEILECFNRMAEELSGVEEMRNEIVASISHELKTPLSVIQNYSSLLLRDDLSEEERKHHAQILVDVCKKQTNLITNILKLNKLEHTGILPLSAPYLLSERLTLLLLSFEKQLEEKEIELSVDLDEEIFTEIDPELLDIVWSNLISNALKFTEPRGSLSLSLQKEGTDAIVSVKDSGCGISPEVGKHMFETFYQGDPSRSTDGNGLGLALVRRVIDIVGGEISVESREKEGSTFHVRLRRIEK